ncbi:MAG: DMT family transporter, partial [Chlamydiota bacterium]
MLVIISFFLFALTTSFAKSISVRIHPFESVFLQSAFATLILLPYALKEGIRGLIPQNKGWHLLRDVTGCLAFACSFYATLSIPITDAMLLYSANALWIPVILWGIFRQKIPFKLLICIVLGFMGVMLILKPASSLFAVGSLWG